METFRYHSARAQCQRLGQFGQMQASYYGPLCERAFEHLAPQVLDATKDASALMVRMDASLMMMGRLPVPPIDGYKLAPPPACVIVRADQYAVWSDYAISLSAHGVRRVVFLDSQMDLALLWLERRSVQRALLQS